MSRSLSHERLGETKCVLDRTIVNKHTISDIADIGQSFMASLCGRNRGVFVLDPPDGNTYGCVAFPANFAELAGVDTDVEIKDSNAIKEQFVAGNITASDTVDLLDYFVQAVYHTSANVKETPYGCDVGGLAELQCGTAPPSLLSGIGNPIRSATLAGAFVPAPWATGGKTLSLDDAKEFYTAADFADMKELGLNTVQVPVFTSAFVESAASGGEEDSAVTEAVSDMLGLVADAALGAILELVKDKDQDVDTKEAATAAAAFASKNSAVIAITLPSMDSDLVAAARTVAPTLPLLLPANGGDLRHLHAYADGNVYAALDMSHTSTIGDVASSTSTDDRMKMFYHEATSCISRSPIEYAHCYRHVPVLVSSGFDLAIDDCVHQEGSSVTFKDYGQCERFDETIDSDWWHRHRRSFAARQVFAYERTGGLGWNFAAWKLHGQDNGEGEGVIDTPAKLLSLRDVAAAGLMPSLEKESPAALACLNPPVSDFLLGDDTLAPTPGPPPDCGNGWWNFTTSQCDYWIPPPEPEPLSCDTSTTAVTGVELGLAALGGAVGAAVICAIVLKIRGGKSGGYETLP